MARSALGLFLFATCIFSVCKQQNQWIQFLFCVFVLTVIVAFAIAFAVTITLLILSCELGNSEWGLTLLIPFLLLPFSAIFLRGINVKHPVFYKPIVLHQNSSNNQKQIKGYLEWKCICTTTWFLFISLFYHNLYRNTNCFEIKWDCWWCFFW